MVALVGEAGSLHVVAGSVCQAPSPREKGQALRFLQHNFQLLKVLKPSHVLVLDRKEKKKSITSSRTNFHEETKLERLLEIIKCTATTYGGTLGLQLTIIFSINRLTEK